jgi:hypothetical protein
MLDIDEIRARVAEIQCLQHDSESAHWREDSLYADFVNHVASYGPPDLAEMAREVLKTQETYFDRWYA